MKENYVIGIDLGTDSIRAIVIDAKDGTQLGEGVFEYPRWKKQLYCDATKDQFRQHPLDHIEGLEASVKKAIADADSKAQNSKNKSATKTAKAASAATQSVAAHIKAIAVDTTGSTPGPVDEHGTPLGLLPQFADNPNAMFVLWKDHTSVKEAKEINKLAHSGKFEDFTKYVGGVYSSEWYWAKMLHIFKNDAAVHKATYSWVEHADWIPALLTGNTHPQKMARSRCAAGHKAMWNSNFNGLPSEEFLCALDPPPSNLLKGIRSRLYTDTQTADIPVGTLSKEWASKFGLAESVVVAGGAFDAHFGAVGGEIQNLDMVKVIGTSTCDIVIASYDNIKDTLVKGICGQVDGSVVPNYIGLEAGQSAFGDLYAWFRDLLLGPLLALIKSTKIISEQQKTELAKELADNLLAHLNTVISGMPPSSQVIALDWIHGRRTPNANQLLTGAISGLKMGTDAYQIYRALVEATAFGARSIQECFISQGININRVIAVGGVARKSPFTMQVLADVLNRTVYVSASDQTCALGSAMYASVVGGIYRNIEEAQKHMGMGFDKVLNPRKEYVAVYDELYKKYVQLGNFVESQTEKFV